MKHTQIQELLSKIAQSNPPFAAARMSAAIVYKGDIVSIGWNRNKTHPFQKKYGSNEDAIFLHAEIDAIVGALRTVDLDTIANSTLYVSRVKWADSDKNKILPGLAKPCEGCMRAIAAFDIKHVCFTTEDGSEYL